LKSLKFQPRSYFNKNISKWFKNFFFFFRDEEQTKEIARLKETVQIMANSAALNAASTANNTTNCQMETNGHFTNGGSGANPPYHNLPKINPNLLDELKRNFSSTTPPPDATHHHHHNNVNGNGNAENGHHYYQQQQQPPYNHHHYHHQHQPRHTLQHSNSNQYLAYTTSLQEQPTFQTATATPYQTSSSTSSASNGSTSNGAMHMLNNDLSKFKSSLIKKGSLANRHLPQPVNSVGLLPSNNQQQVRTVYLTNANSATNSQDEETDTATTATTATTNDGDEFCCNEYLMDDMEDSYVRRSAGSLAGVGLANNGSIEFRVSLSNHKLNGIDLSSANQQQPQQQQMMHDDFMLHSNTAPVPSFLITTTKKTTKSTITLPQQQQHQYQQQQQPASFIQPVEDWSCESVAQWLAINDLGDYVDAFLDKDVDGEELMQLDTSKLKVIKL
jgi:hypothetical protein